MNPGFVGRFKTTFTFEDYAPETLLKMFDRACKSADIFVEPAARDKVWDYFFNSYQNRDETYSNARMVRNVFEKAESNVNARIGDTSRHNAQLASTILLEDIELD